MESLGIFYQVLLSAEKFPELLSHPTLEMHLSLGVGVVLIFLLPCYFYSLLHFYKDFC